MCIIENLGDEKQRFISQLERDAGYGDDAGWTRRKLAAKRALANQYGDEEEQLDEVDLCKCIHVNDSIASLFIVIEEIEERKQFLDEMKELGSSKAYLKQITAEISQVCAMLLLV